MKWKENLQKISLLRVSYYNNEAKTFSLFHFEWENFIEKYNNTE